MWKELISLEWNRGKTLSKDVFETKYPCLFKWVNDTWYLTVLIDDKIHFLWSFLEWVFHFRPFLTEIMLDNIEANLQLNDIVILKEEIQDNVLVLISWFLPDMNNDTKKD